MREMKAIERTIERLQSEGRNIYIAAFTEDGEYALVVDEPSGQVYVAPVGQANGVGRWECTVQHRARYADLYAQRFPRIPAEVES